MDSLKVKLDWDAIEKRHPFLNRKKDKGPVIQGLGVDITACIEQNQLPTGDTPVVYNSLQVNEVSGRVNCVFDVLNNEIKAAGFASSSSANVGASVGASGRASTAPAE